MNKLLQTLDRRLPPVNAAGGLFNIKAFKALPYSTYTAAGFLSFLGLYTGTSDIWCFTNYWLYITFFFTVLTYIDVAAAADGVDNGFAFYLVSIANAASFFGRMGGGLLADKIGKSTRDDTHWASHLPFLLY